MRERRPLAKCFDRKRFAVILVLFLVACAAFPVRGADGDQDEVRKLVKKSIKLTRAGRIPEAEALLRKALEIDSANVSAKTELAFVFVKQRLVRPAYDLCFPIVKDDPKNARAISVLGAVMLTAGRFEDARSLFNAALFVDKHQHLAWAGIGMLDFYENKVNDSLDNLRQAVYDEPEEPDYVFSFAQVAARSEQYKVAADAYNRFLLISKNTDKDRRERIQGLVQFLTYLGNTGGLYISNGREQTTVPFELVGNRPVIALMINGKKEPLRFVLDTGSGISVMSLDAAARLGIKPVAHGGFARGIGGDGKFEIIYGQLKSVAIGDVQMRNVPVYLRKFHNPGNEVDGYIGLALISKFLTTIDYGNKTFELTRKDADREGFTAKADISLPLRLTSSGFLSGEVSLQGIDAPLNFIVDTGASVSVISDAVSKADGMSRYMNEEKLRVVGSAGITEDVPTFLLPKISFGSHSIESVKAVALNLDIINETAGFEQAGILGGNFLKNYRLTFDFKNSKVIFVSVKPDRE